MPNATAAAAVAVTATTPKETADLKAASDTNKENDNKPNRNEIIEPVISKIPEDAPSQSEVRTHQNIDLID